MIEIIPNWHPIFVHFTVALLTMSVGFYALVFLIPGSRFREQWSAVARWNLWSGVLFALITGLTGWLAYNSVAHDTPSHLAMTDHRNWAFSTLGVFIPAGLWSAWRTYKGLPPSLVLLLLLLIGFGLLASTAWRGGEVVYRHGLGVRSLPEPVLQELPAMKNLMQRPKTKKTKSSDGHDHVH